MDRLEQLGVDKEYPNLTAYGLWYKFKYCDTDDEIWEIVQNDKKGRKVR